MMLFSMLSAAQGGKSIAFLSRHFGLSNRQMTNVIRYFLPILMRGIQKNLAKNGGLTSLMKELDHGNYSSYYEDPNIYSNPDVRLNGLLIMEKAVGDEVVQKQMLSRIYLSTGVDPDCLQLILPYVTTLALSALYRKAHTSVKPEQAQSLSYRPINGKTKPKTPALNLNTPEVEKTVRKPAIQAGQTLSHNVQQNIPQNASHNTSLAEPQDSLQSEIANHLNHYSSEPQPAQPLPQEHHPISEMPASEMPVQAPLNRQNGQFADPVMREQIPQQPPAENFNQAPIDNSQMNGYVTKHNGANNVPQMQQPGADLPVQHMVGAQNQERLPNIILQAQEAYAKKQRKKNNKSRLKRMLLPNFKKPIEMANVQQNTNVPQNANVQQHPNVQQHASVQHNAGNPPEFAAPQTQQFAHTPIPPIPQPMPNTAPAPAQQRNNVVAQQTMGKNVPGRKYVSLQEKLSNQLPWYEQVG